MYREILFRGFAPDEKGKTTVFIDGKTIKGKWLYGSLIHDRDLKQCCIVGYNYYESGDGLQREEFCNVVISSTVGQYTEEIDKYQCKVFTDDIVRYKDIYTTVYGVVRFGEITVGNETLKYSGYYIEWINNGENKWKEWWRDDLKHWLRIEPCEIYGNIYENPEVKEEPQ